MKRPCGPCTGGKVRRATIAFALTVALLAATGTARGEAQDAPGDSLERAATLLQSHEFGRAAATLRDLLLVDPTNRHAREMLAFALESMGDLAAERRVRSALAADFPDEPRIQADLGRVLERSGDETGALRAYRRARELSPSEAPPELEAAIERMQFRTASEAAAPVSVLSDPDAIATRVQAGVAVPLGSRHHLAVLGTRLVARGRATPGATESAALALSVVRHGTGASWMAGPRLLVAAPRLGGQSDVRMGGTLAGRAALGPLLEADGRAELEAPWDEAAVAALHGGRTTAAEGHLYAHLFSRRLLLQAGARRRRLSIFAADSDPTNRPRAWQSLWIAGADLVLWRKPGAELQGEMLDEALIAPRAVASATTLTYRHYDISTRATPEFDSLIGLAQRGSVDEVSAATTCVSLGEHVGLELRGGLAFDSARRARVWRAGGGLTWAPVPAARFSLGYEKATEAATGLVGRSGVGGVSFHVDL